MQETEVSDPPQPLSPAARSYGRQRSRLWTVLGLLLLVLLLAFLPPLLNIGRYQRRIAGSIGLSLGRPVHLDHVSLNLLPVPSLTIRSFVVDEDPAFGDEPIVRADTVVANLRVSSLWRRRIEISRIRFTDPSVNLVLRPDGRWNLENVLLQASHIDAAPTAQRTPGAAPRFPYIEATGARLNVKLGQRKTPFSLTEADFALWLPEPQVWRMRLRAKPVRTDTSVSDTGLVQAEVTLRRAPSAALVPMSLEGAWHNAPLGAVSRIVFGRDLDVRGTMDLAAKAEGTLAESALDWRINLLGLHRADYIPSQPLHFVIDCTARPQRVFHALDDVRCTCPVPESNGATLALTGSIPDLLRPDTAELQLGTGRLPAANLLSWLHVLSPRLPPDLTASGSLSASLSHDPPRPLAVWSGEAIVDALSLQSTQLGETALSLGTVSLSVGPGAQTQGRAAPGARGKTARRLQGQSRATDSASGQIVLEPVAVALGGPSPATIEAHADRLGYTVHLSGYAVPSRLLAISGSLPPFGDGLASVLPDPDTATAISLDLTASRPWGGAQTWTDNTLRATQTPALRRPVPH